MPLSAQLIRDARTAAGLTQAELAKRARTSQPAIAAYESGDKVPTVATLERLLGAAGVDLTATRRAEPQRTIALRRLVSERRHEILEIARTHGASNVRVFGSVARGEETDESDIDLLVDMQPGTSLLDMSRLRRALSELLGVKVDLVSSRGLSGRNGTTILQEAVAV